MNRLEHLQKTLHQNMLDNFMLEDVEFVLLDYNSTDGLEDWVKNNMQGYIKSGILTYYKTLTPTSYYRSHSRNMAFKLADAELVCNLDADNFLGKGFASFMMDAFINKHKILYTSHLNKRDIGGRICFRKKDFIEIRGYNEMFKSYGLEDIELIFRFHKNGYIQEIFYNPEFYEAIHHSHEKRFSEESFSKDIYKIFISYQTPFITKFLILKTGNSFEKGTFIDNYHLNIRFLESTDDFYTKLFDERSKIVIKNWEQGKWDDTEKKINLDTQECFFKENKTLKNPYNIYYEIEEDHIKLLFLMTLSEAKNYSDYATCIEQNGNTVNPDGFGKGIVYKNFNYDNAIKID
jgi:hypothetical protein